MSDQTDEIREWLSAATDETDPTEAQAGALIAIGYALVALVEQVDRGEEKFIAFARKVAR